MKETENQSDSIYGEPVAPPPPLHYDEKPIHPSIAAGIILFVLWFMVSVFSGCTTSQVTAGWETAKSRSQFGLGNIVHDGTWTGPLQFTWLSEPKPEAQPPVLTEITPAPK